MQEKLFNYLAWLTARHITHFEAQQQLVARIGSWAMDRVHGRLASYYREATLQQHELHELKALSAAFDIKEMAASDEGWVDHHGIGLNMVAGVLMEQHDWDAEDIHDFVDDLTDGHFSFASFEDEED